MIRRHAFSLNIYNLLCYILFLSHGVLGLVFSVYVCAVVSSIFALIWIYN